MDEKLPFAEFYRLVVDEALGRAGRPDSDLFTKLATAPGINSKYYLRLSRRDWLASAEGARDIEPCAFFHPKIKSHFLRYYGPTAYNLHYMEVYARANERLRQSPELIEHAEQHVAEVISAATKEVDQYTSAAEQILKDNGVGQSVRYGTGPLLVPAEIISPYCGTYLELIMKADRLLSLLEYQRLRRYITNVNCDREFSRVDRLLKSVASAAFGLAKGLRQRTYAPTESEESTEAASVAADNGAKAPAAKVDATDTADSTKSARAGELATPEAHAAAVAA
jgi:dihydroneopterin aldolase